MCVRYNWEHYGNPDGPQAMQFGIGLPAWIVEEKNSVFVLGVYALIFMIGLPVAVWYWWSRSSKYSGEQVTKGKNISILTFLAVQDSSIGDIVSP